MRYSVLISLVVICLLGSCTSAYRHLQRTEAGVGCIRQFSPAFTNTLYSTQVNILKHHLSGLLFFKQMEDSSLRVVFANEMGFKFFDFEFDKNGHFTKHYLLPKMDKPAIVKTLQQDFELVLLRPDLRNAYVAKDDNYRYVVVPTEKGNNYYITNADCTELVRIEKSSRRKPVVQVWMEHYRNQVPDTIRIQHTGFNFNISLQHVEK
jgi:hypothetical protein